MSALTEQITKVLRANPYRAELSCCRDEYDHAAHVASVLEAELHLTEEWAVYRPKRSEGSPVWRTSRLWCEKRVEFLNDRYGDDEAVLWSRWVSVGSPVPEEQP